MNTPFWVSDNPLISNLLSRFLDKCDRPSTKHFRESINRRRTPELFDFSSSANEELWNLIERKLHLEYGVIQRIQYKRNALTVERYENALLYFNPSSEKRVREWLQRPKVDSLTAQWCAALESYPQFKNTSLSQAIRFRYKSASEVLAGFAHVEQELARLSKTHERISLRGLSSRCFWGDSKFLDERRALVLDVFPSSEALIKPRALMLSAYLPPMLKQLIFVENFDSFLSLVKAVESSAAGHTTAVIYSAGYRGSAHRIRQVGNSQFVTINAVNEAIFQHFSDWWYGRSERQVTCFFWGDFDYEAMSILNGLRQNFANTTAWQPGYQAMLNYHNNGLGHTPEQANKTQQRLPEKTNCDYADKILIPLLKTSQRFIDQEVIGESQLLQLL